MSNLTKAQEFIKTLERELKRLSPTLNLTMTNLDPYSQIIYIVRVAIDTLIDERKSIESEYLKLSHDSCPHSASSDQADVQQAKSKLIDAQKQLKIFERLVRQKEKKIQEREKELESRNQLPNHQDFSFDQTHSTTSQKNKEIEARIKALIEKEEEVKQASDLLSKERKRFEGEKLAVFHMKSQIQHNDTETEKIKSQVKTTLESLQNDREKLKFEEKILHEKEEALKLKQDYIEKTLSDLEKRKKNLEEEKSRFRIEKSSLSRINTEFKYESQEDNRKFGFADFSSNSIKTLTDTPERGHNKELDNLYTQLHEQMEVYNQEVSLREEIINEKQRKLKQAEEKFKRKEKMFIDYEIILLNIKKEIIEFKSNILEEFETMFRRLKVQFELITRKISEVDKLQVKMNESIFLKNPNY